MIYFTADTHFFWSEKRGIRPGTLMVGERTFASVEEKTEYLVSRWNSTVGVEDEVYILGDFSDGTAADTAALLQRLHGKSILSSAITTIIWKIRLFHRNCFAGRKRITSC